MKKIQKETNKFTSTDCEIEYDVYYVRCNEDSNKNSYSYLESYKDTSKDSKQNLEYKSHNTESLRDCSLSHTSNHPQNAILVQIAHGMVEHKDKYKFIATKLAQMGYIVAINDHRGHGNSIGGEIFWGEMGENGFEMAVEDLHTLHTILCERFKPKKFVLIGHSMGSLISRRYLQKYESNIDCLILCGTPSPHVCVNVGIRFLKTLRILGINRIGRKIANRFSFASFNAKYHKPPYDEISSVRWINRDENELRRHISDEKCRFLFTINSFINLLGGVRTVFGKYPNPVRKPNLPIIFMSGEDDACGQFGKGVLSAFKHIQSQGYQNVKCTLYGGARHEILLELNKEEVAKNIIDFIEQNL
ncbi:alpha/beta hydrolase [Helicobacter didelphidarum]|uniref:Alpha/beta hydrolase n=1 Tax=Helicobacter didelphidarum TaxID=2040648 RepID=A0A3D8IQ95_9HELI|nr:alpha/beta hydrolase [Helicobacter didelphidarum]RDU67076.1 alpha/beta hydrolase [Helicobacter didelphidarum]